MQKAVMPHRRQQRFEEKGLVLHSQRTAFRTAQKGVYLTFIEGKQLGDDRLLVTEVVVQVTRRNPQVRRDMVGGDTALTLRIKQRQAFLNDAFAGFQWR